MGELLVLVVVVVSAIVVHEAAHVLAAKAVGHEVFEIQIGGGPVWRFRVGTVDVAVGPIPLGGHVQTGDRSGERFRSRSAVVAGAGIAANLVFAGLGFAAGAPAVASLNLLIAAANLWPGERRRLGAASSDGRLLLDLVRNDRDALAEERSGWFCVQAMRARDAGDLDEAEQLVALGRQEAGDTRALLAVGGMVAFEQRRFEDVVAAYAPLIDDPRITMPGRAGFAADAAWAASLTEDVELRALAEPWAAFARRVRPRSDRRRLVLGLAQVDAGLPGEALRTLKGLVDPSASAVRVLALVAAGRLAEARALHADAVRPHIEADHPLARRAATAVGEGEHRGPGRSSAVP